MARRLLIRALPVVVALRFVAFLIFSPATTSPAICAPVVSARFPSARAPRLIRGATDRRRPLNKLPKPCPFWTRAPVKYGNAPPICLCVVIVVIHLNRPVLRRRKCSVTVTFPRSNGAGRPVSSLIYVSIVPNSRLITGIYCTCSKRVVTISPCCPVMGTIRNSGTILSPTTRGSTILE